MKTYLDFLENTKEKGRFSIFTVTSRGAGYTLRTRFSHLFL